MDSDLRECSQSVGLVYLFIWICIGGVSGEHSVEPGSKAEVLIPIITVVTVLLSIVIGVTIYLCIRYRKKPRELLNICAQCCCNTYGYLKESASPASHRGTRNVDGNLNSIVSHQCQCAELAQQINDSPNVGANLQKCDKCVCKKCACLAGKNCGYAGSQTSLDVSPSPLRLDPSTLLLKNPTSSTKISACSCSYKPVPTRSDSYESSSGGFKHHHDSSSSIYNSSDKLRNLESPGSKESNAVPITNDTHNTECSAGENKNVPADFEAGICPCTDSKAVLSADDVPIQKLFTT